jgi:D-alanyl-D-alanine carboxypeptidase
MFKSFAAIVVVLVGLDLSATSQMVTLDDLFDHIEKADRGMGTIAIRVNGKSEYNRSTGYAHIASARKADPNTLYRIGSISKSFTSVLVLQLVGEGLISLEDTIERFFPEIPTASKITVAHLLLHQSGLYNFTSDRAYETYMSEPQSRNDLLARFKSYPSAFEPGTSADYSNTNYVLLTFLIEDLTGRSYDEVLQDGICKPCGLKNTYMGQGKPKDAREATSYDWKNEWRPASVTDMSIPLGAGAIVSTASEIAKFYECLFESDILSESLRERMTTPDKGFGMGIFPLYFDNKVSYGHSGGIDGFQSVASYFPKEKIAVAYLSNAVQMDVNSIGLGVLQIYFGKHYSLPEFKAPIVVDEKILNSYVGNYKSNIFPLDMEIFVTDGMLHAQATGQPSFYLEPRSETIFVFDLAGVEIEFKPELRQLLLRQAGGVYTFNFVEE